MIDWKITPSVLQGTLLIPPSKSQSMRALLFGMLAKGKSLVKNVLSSPDIHAMILACNHLGAILNYTHNSVEIKGTGGKLSGAEDVIQSGNSGLLFRFIGAVAALSTKPIVVTGDASIRHRRPITPLLDALTQLGVSAISTRGDGGAPIIVQGPLCSGAAYFNGADSQPVSGMLIASAFAQGPIELFVTHPGETPWITLTLDWFSKLGIACRTENFEKYSLKGGAQIEGFEYQVPADFSSLSYPLAAALLTHSEIKIEHLNFKDPQGDKKIIDYLQQMGATFDIDEAKGSLFVRKSKSLRGVSINVNECIDSVPLLAVLGCYAEGKTEITGATIAKQKECDRLSCITQELRKMGARIEEHSEGLTVYPHPLIGNEVYSHQDHRIALSLAIAGLVAKGETLIRDVICVEKSFPCFRKQMQEMGAHIYPFHLKNWLSAADE